MTLNARTARRHLPLSVPSPTLQPHRTRVRLGIATMCRLAATDCAAGSRTPAQRHSNEGRHPEDSCDQGSASLIAVVVMAGLLAMVALVVDGGGRVAAAITADNAAAAAARAGGQAIDTTAVMAGEPIAADPVAAAAAARAHLRAAGVTGDARVEPGGRSIVVTTTVTYEPVFLGLLGVGQTPITGSARAALVDLQIGLPGSRP